MPNYTPNLALILPVANEYPGTWGDQVNNGITSLTEQAISGYTTQVITDGADTVITIPSGSTGVARNMYIELTSAGNLTANRNLIVPANKKLYFIFNNTTGSPSGFAVTVKVSGMTGISVPNGKKMLLVCNGTDIVEATTYFAALSCATLTASGAVTLSPANATVTISPTGTGTVTIAPATSGTLNNVSLGATTPGNGAFNTLTVAGPTIAVNGFYLPAATAITTAGASGTSTTATVTFAVQTLAPAVGSLVTVAGVSPAGYNGTYVVTASTTSSVSYANTTTGPQTVAGTATMSFHTLAFSTNSTQRGTVTGFGAWSLNAPSTATVTLTVNGVAGTHSTQIADNNNTKYDAGYLGIPQITKTASYTMTLQERGKHISSTAVGSAITVTSNPETYNASASNTTWTAGDSFVIYNNTAVAQTLTAGTSPATVTFLLAGTATTGNRTLAQRGVATLLCVVGGSPPTFVVSGAGVT
jgi:hypothetical protein